MPPPARLCRCPTMKLAKRCCGSSSQRIWSGRSGCCTGQLSCLEGGSWFFHEVRGCGRIQCVPRVRTLRLVTEARRNSQNVWSINGLDGTTHQLPVDETDANVTRQHLTAKSWVNLLKQTLKVFVFGVFMPLKTWISREKLLRGSRKEAARF